MEEPDERDASSGVSESTVTAGEHVADGNLVGSGVSVSKERVQSSLSEEVGRAEGGDGACNGGEDIMVEVLGSDVYFDGVCTDRTAGNLDEVGSGGSTGKEPSVERDGISPCGDGGVVDEPDVGVSGGTGSEGVLGAGESIKETSQEVAEGAERAVDAMVLDNDAREDDSVVAGPMDRETEAVHMEEENTGSKEAMDVQVSQVGSSQGTLVHNSPDDKVLNNEEPQKVEVNSEQSKNSPTENGFGDELVHAGGESQLVTEEAPISDEGESLEKGTGEESVEEDKQIVDKPVDLQSTRIGISDVDARDPGIKTSTSSADGSENSNSRGQDATEKAPDMFIEKDLNPEVISHIDGSEKIFSNLERDESCIFEMEHEDIAKSDYIDDQNRVAGGGELPNSTLSHGQKISGTEQLGLCAGPSPVEVPEIAAQALDSEILDPTIAVPENVVSMDSISSSQPNQRDAEVDVAPENDSTILAPSIEVSAENEQNLNVQTECRNMESDPQSNGQGGDIGMNVEHNAVTDNTLADFENVEEMEVDQNSNVNQVGLHGEEEMEEVTGIDNDDDQIVKCADENPESSVQLLQARYQLPSEYEGDFSVSDLVWGKVRSHPWWPGQIFDPSDSSEKAMKYYKKDFFLVAYFGDRTFAWNEVSHLKPFRTHFSQEEMQSNSEAFQNAVECALEEVSRRSELGLACACTPREAYDMIKCQIVENAGIREESSRRYGVDKSASATSFEPAKLIEYIRDLAKFPADGSDRLELVIAKAQLTAFYRLKGYCGLPQFQFCGLPQFQFCGGLVDNESDSLGIEMQSSDFVRRAAPSQDDAQTPSSQENLEGRSSSYHKRKHNLKDGLYPKKKERSLNELMGETFDNLDGENWSDAKTTTTLVSPSAKRRKTVEHPTDDSGTPDGRKTISFAKISGNAALKQSFKIGDCIRRVASQLTGTSPIVKSSSERFQKPDGGFDGHAGYESDVFFQNFDDAQKGRVNFPIEYSSLDELLGQLQLVATDPMKEYSFLNVIVSFFNDFRDSLILRQQSGIEDLATDRVNGKRKAQFTSTVASPQTFEFEDMSDTYWTDRVIQNGTEVPPARRTRKRDYQLALAEPEKALQGSRRPYKKRHSVGNHAMTAEKFTGSVDQPSPAELIMNFSEVDSVPSEKTLNNMFRRFGPLRESETEVDREGGRARVVFKKSSDAEIAYSSAGRFSIFGPRLVNYQLSYTPSTLFKASPIPRLQDQEMHLDLSTTQFQEMQLDLASFHDHEMQLDLSSIHDQEMQLDLSTIEYQEMESVLDPHHDQESKPNYTSAQLGEMQAGFSTIQYERQPDLSSIHDQELHTVFSSNQETQSGPIASQDQELQHNFTSTQLGDMQADHTLTHHDEPPVSASTQEQKMQPVFATIKEEKTQPAITTLQAETQSVFATIQEQETHAILDTTQLDGMQADLTPTHHEKQTVPATSQEQEMQPVFAMIQEGTQPVLATSQEQEKVAVIGTTIHHEEQPVPSTAQDQEMQPVLATNQANEMLPVLTSAQDNEREPLTASEELMGEPVPTMTEEQETQHSLCKMKGHEAEDVLGTKEQATQCATITTDEQEDKQPLVLMGEVAQEETQLAPAMTEGQETQVLGTMEGHETEHVLGTIERHETEHVLGTKEDAAQSVTATDEQDDAQPLVLTGEEAQEETQPILASTQELETEPDLTSAQELEPDEDAMQRQELQSDHGTTEEHEAVPDSVTSQVQDMQSNHATGLEQDVLPDNATNEVPEVQCDDGTDREQEVQHGINTNQEQEKQHDNATDQEQEKQCDNATDQEQEKQHDNATNQEQEKQCDNATDQEQEMQCVNATNQEQMQCDNPTNQEQEMQCDNATNQEQEMQCDNATNQEQEMRCDNASDQEQEMQCDDATNQEQEMQCDDATNQEREMQCDNDTNKKHVVQSGEATPNEQDVQSDHEQKLQTDHATNQEQETTSNFATLHEQDIQCDVAEKHLTQDQAMQPDLATISDPETHPDFVPTKDQEMQLGLSSLEKNTD